ncbi:MAG: integral rane sensor signal transduction histidine kinase [Herbinix sp.]|jgi:two-component system sensor histidine kinase YesM|nr:integral rane sensor signal transduction histidine kinase [Herbinix sp.]
MTDKKKVPLKRFSSHFSSKLFIAFFCCVMFPISIIFLVNNYRSEQLIKSQAVYSNEKVLSQAADFLEYKISSLKNIIDIISLDDTVQTILKTSNSYYRENKGNWFIQTTDMKNIIYNSYLTSDIESVRLYMPDGPASFEETAEFKELSEAEQSDWYVRINEIGLLSTAWIPSSFFDPEEKDSYVSIVKRIPNMDSINKYIGIIKGDIPSIFFDQIIAQMTITPDTTVVLYNSHKEIITSAGNKAFMKLNTLQNLLTDNSITGDGTLSYITDADEDYLIGSYDLTQADWKLVMLIPMTDVLSPSKVYRYQILLISILVVAYLIPALYITSHSITRRIRRLEHHMKKAISNNFDIAPLKNGSDEIGNLTASFDQLVEKIRYLMEKQYEYGYEIKNLELKVLQSLINPHFLYNTLDMIYWLSIKNNVPAISATVNSLAQFYKLSLGHGEDFVLLSSELDHVRAYVNIQNMRFEDRIQLRIDIEEQFLSCQIIKIILQPLVENSILHGIRERKDESGTIYIKAREKDNKLIITVADSGVGMSEETLQNLRDKPNSNTSYGVWNINERIRLCYGEDYGLYFTSKQNRGTCVFITVPLSLTSDSINRLD